MRIAIHNGLEKQFTVKWIMSEFGDGIQIQIDQAEGDGKFGKQLTIGPIGCVVIDTEESAK